MNVSRTGFRTTTISGLTADVQGSLVRDVVLQIGAASVTVTVRAEAGDEMVAQMSSELGTEIGHQQIHDLPLNGRNFTELLTLTPGATPVSTAQSNSVVVNDLGVLGVPTAEISQPAIQGQINRENLYLLDGVVNTEFTTSVYVIPPIIDDMQEFKVQSHDDKAEYGGVLGGVINVVTKSGTNSLHGAAWEFVRNNVFDARDSFLDEYSSGPSPFRQNQFGATVGGPVLLPKLYNGRNRTFFLFGYEGWRYDQSGEIKYNVPTNQELSGDFSNSLLTQNIFDPASTAVDSSAPSGYSRMQFARNLIPSSRLDQTMVNFINTYYARPNLTGNPYFNAIVTRPHIDDSDHYMVRFDEQLSSKDMLFFRYDQLNVTDLRPITISQSSGASVAAKNLGAGWSHAFTPNLLFDFRFGIARRPFDRSVPDSNGSSAMQKLGFTNAGGTTISLQSPYGGGGLNNVNTIESPVTSYTPSLTWVHGVHNLKFGVQYIEQGNDSNSPPYGAYSFANATTGDPNLTGTTGNSLASALLGFPASNNNTTLVANSNRVSSYGYFAQDVWSATRNVTITYGLRLDHRRPFAPSASTVVSGFNTDGNYWIGLKVLPPACGTAYATPCIPSADGSLAGIANFNGTGSHIVLSPYGRAWGDNGGWGDWGPRIGVAWRVNPKTTVRGGYGIEYDTVMGMEQDWKGNSGNWPAAGAVVSTISINGLAQPLTTIEQTRSSVGTQLAPDPWSQINWYLDPHMKDPRSQQYNLTVEREIGGNTALSVGYVGSVDGRLGVTSQWNTAQTAGPGSPAQVQARKPFPWYKSTAFYSFSRGTSSYNALQVKLDRRFSNGLQYLVSYTWSKSIDTGGSGLFDVENGAGGYSVWQNEYDLAAAKGVSGYNIPQFLTMSGLYTLPFGQGQRYLNHGVAGYLLGNWQANTAVQLRSGQPYNLQVSGDVANIGQASGNNWFSYERPNQVGNPKPAHRSANEWYNPASFQVPSFSYGDAGRDLLSSSHVADADMSLFKNFPIREQFALSFRAEFFNVFNIQNYGVPDPTITDPTAGVITSNVTTPRQIQLGLHLNF